MIKVVTGKVRFSYLYVFEPRTQESGDSKYSVTLLIPKSDSITYNKIINAMTKTLEDGVGTTFGGVKPTNPKMPLYDGDGYRPSGEPFGEECKGHFVITASSNDKPEIVDQNLNPILSKSELYSGCFGRVSLNFFAYNKNGNRGVGCGLMNLQKLEDGPSLTGRTTAAEDFADGEAQQPAISNQQVYGQVNYIPQQQISANPYGAMTPQYGAPQPTVNPITGEPINIMGVN